MSAPADRDQRTEKPTPKRIKEFRKRGEIARSRDVTMVASLLGGLLAALAFTGTTTGAIEDLSRRALSGASGRIDPGLAGAAVRTFVVASLPAIIGALVGYLVATMVQLGWPPPLKFPRFNIGKLFTLDSIKNILSPSAMARRALGSTAKVTVVAVAGIAAVGGAYDDFSSTPRFDVAALADRLDTILLRLVTYSGMALAALAGVDYWWQRRQLAAKMRMTKEEIKREHKEQDGDPVVVRRRRQRQRELAQRRVKPSVESADVVIVNPSHYAVALRYRPEESGAPVVVAKGTDQLAEFIRKVAREAGVPVVSRPPLTRLIHKLVPEGREIPGEVYTAVAEVLAYVYKIRARTSR